MIKYFACETGMVNQLYNHASDTWPWCAPSWHCW